MAKAPSNPFTAIVAAIPSEEGLRTALGDGAEDSWFAVLSVGEADGIRLGQAFVIFALGEELVNPVTKEPLGHFELVRGTGEVMHVQERMCTVRSTNTRKEVRPMTNALLQTGRGETISVPVPFSYLRVGDFARRT